MPDGLYRAVLMAPLLPAPSRDHPPLTSSNQHTVESMPSSKMTIPTPHVCHITRRPLYFISSQTRCRSHLDEKRKSRESLFAIAGRHRCQATWPRLFEPQRGRDCSSLLRSIAFLAVSGLFGPPGPSGCPCSNSTWFRQYECMAVTGPSQVKRDLAGPLQGPDKTPSSQLTKTELGWNRALTAS